MTNAVQLYCWHFMAYPHLPADFDEKYDSGWVTVPNSLWDAQKSRGLYQQYIDQLAYADELGFDGMVLNEHHQNIYGLMPSPNLIAAALTQTTKRGKIVILGNLLPLHLNPLRVAEEYAMLDNMSDGRLIAGFAPGSGPETFNYNVPSAPTRGQFWEAVDFIARAWTQPGPFAHEGRHYPMRYVNPWPLPTQKPHPPIWIPGSRSRDTLVEIAKRGYCYFLSSRSHGKETARSQQMFAKILEEHGDRYQPSRMGILMSAYVAETDAQAQAEAKEGVWYFLKNCLKGHLRRVGPPAHLRARHPLHPAGGVQALPASRSHRAAPGRRRDLGRPAAVGLDRGRQRRDGLSPDHGHPHAFQGRQSPDPVPSRQHGDADAQEHAAVRERGGAAAARDSCSRANSRSRAHAGDGEVISSQEIGMCPLPLRERA